MMTIQTMTLEDLELVLRWAKQEGWNPGNHDAESFYQADPKGFFLKTVDGAPAAAISVVNHSERFSFLGLYICAPEFRGQGHGFSVWQAGLAHAGDRTVGLDGVPDQQANYEASGFVSAGSTTRYSGWPEASARSARPAVVADLPEISALDRVQTGVSRPAFIDPWLVSTSTRQTFVLHGGGDGIEGFCTVRRCAEGCKLGPFAALTEPAARGLLTAAANWAGQGPLIIDVPDASYKLSALLGELGFTASFATARMYLGPPPDAQPWPLQAAATLELG